MVYQNTDRDQRILCLLGNLSRRPRRLIDARLFRCLGLFGQLSQNHFRGGASWDPHIKFLRWALEGRVQEVVARALCAAARCCRAFCAVLRVATLREPNVDNTIEPMVLYYFRHFYGWVGAALFAPAASATPPLISVEEAELFKSIAAVDPAPFHDYGKFPSLHRSIYAPSAAARLRAMVQRLQQPERPQAGTATPSERPVNEHA